MAKASAVAYDESKWRAEADMRTLAEAAAIRRDPKRLAAARKAAKSRLAEMKAETQAISTLAAGKTPG
jgi:hypothetical protein